MKRIYISGPMSGMPEHNFPAFNAEAARLRALGYDVVNPAELNPEPEKTWHDCLRTDLMELLTCDAIALLAGWQKSAGAHLEIHVAHRVGIDIVEAKDILQMALGFEANAEKRLRSKINLQNGGVQFEFVEDEDKDTRTKMQVFERFTLGLPVFDGSSNAYPLEARLKYREREGKVTFWYELIRPDRVFKSAVTDELTRIKEITGFPVISGKP